MPTTLKRYLIVLFSLYPCYLYAQVQTVRYPVRFSQYYTCYQLTNPAGIGAYSEFEASAGNKHYLGNFNKISTYYFNGGMRIASKGARINSSFSSIGILVYNDREGKYLNRSRYYAAYAWHGNITKTIKFSAGFHIGAMNYSVKGTPLSGDGSDTSPDGDIGVWFYNKNFHIGVSYNQIFNSKIQPLEEIAALNSFVNIDGSCNFTIAKDIGILPSYSCRIPLKDDYYALDFSIGVSYKDKITAIIGVHENKNLINSFEIRNILSNNYPLNLNITYGYPFTRGGISTSFIELGLSISH